jgi:RNA polymerase sigma-70 factor (ECF subfamily)
LTQEAIRAYDDKVALDVLFRQHRSALSRYFQRRGLRNLDVEDAISDVFVRLCNQNRTTALESLEGYLFATASSVAVDHFRRSIKRRANAHDEYNEAVHAGEEFSPERIHMAREEIVLLTLALGELSERTRNVFLFARLEGLTYAEVGNRLGLSVSAVEKHVVKATAHLARRVGRL